MRWPPGRTTNGRGDLLQPSPAGLSSRNGRFQNEESLLDPAHDHDAALEEWKVAPRSVEAGIVIGRIDVEETQLGGGRVDHPESRPVVSFIHESALDEQVVVDGMCGLCVHELE